MCPDVKQAWKQLCSTLDAVSPSLWAQQPLLHAAHPMPADPFPNPAGATKGSSCSSQLHRCLALGFERTTLHRKRSPCTCSGTGQAPWKERKSIFLVTARATTSGNILLLHPSLLDHSGCWEIMHWCMGMASLCRSLHCHVFMMLWLTERTPFLLAFLLTLHLALSSSPFYDFLS